MIKWLKIIVVVAAIVYLLVNLFFYFYQEKIIFLDTQLEEGHVFLFDKPFEELTLTTKDGSTIHALHFKTDSPKGIIVYQHGNAGDLERWGNIAEDFVQFNYEVLIWDYRGYGKSRGVRSQSTLLSDGQMMYDQAKKWFPEENIVIYGRSLGTGISTYIAANNQPQKLILETPYYSLKNLVHTEYGFLVTKRFLRYPLRSDLYADQIYCPVMVFHGTADEVVKYNYGKRLFERLSSRDKQMITLPDGEHNNLSSYTQYWENLENFLK